MKCMSNINIFQWWVAYESTIIFVIYARVGTQFKYGEDSRASILVVENKYVIM